MQTDSASPGGAKRLPAPRWKAAGVHLLVGLASGGLALGAMLAQWYPWPLLLADGRALLPAAAVLLAVVLGPLAALFLSQGRPNRWRFDLLVIAILQVAVFAYGLKAVYEERPAYLVFTIDRFDLVAASDLDPSDLAKTTRAEFAELPQGPPAYIAAVMPKEVELQQRVVFSSLGGKDLNLYPQHYVSYAEELPNVLKRAQGLGLLLERDAAAVGRYLDASGRRLDSVRFLPLRARGVDGVVLLDAVSGAPLTILLIEPW